MTDPLSQHQSEYRDANGNSLYSWRLREEILRTQNSSVKSDVAGRLKVSWLDSSNDALRNSVGPDVYSYYGKNKTCVLGITGPGTAFDIVTNSEWGTLNPHLIVLVESSSTTLHWMEPGDLDVSMIPRTSKALGDAGISSQFSAGAHVAFADGEVWFIAATTPLAELRKLMTSDEANRYDREEVLGRYRIK